MAKTFLAEKQKSLPKTTTLFKFLYISAPEIKNDDNLSSRVIINHQKGNSVFIQAIDGLTNPNEINQALKSKIETFNPLISPKEIKLLNPDLYKFAQWLGISSKKNSTQSELQLKSNGIIIYTSTQENILWDNLYFHALTTNDTHTRDAILLVLRANNLLKKFQQYISNTQNQEFSTEDAKKYSDLANALVTIPSELINKQETANSSNNTNEQDKYQTKALEKLQNLDIDSLKITRYESAIIELNNAKKHFDNDFSNQFLVAKEAYEAQIKLLYENAPIDPIENIAIVPPIPAFVFNSQLVFDATYIESKVSAITYNIYLDNVSDNHTSFDDVLKSIESKISDCFDRKTSNTEQNKTLKLYGINLEINNNPLNNSYIINNVKLYDSQDLFAIAITHFSNENNKKINEATATINNLSDQTSETFTSSKPNFQSKNHSTYLLFPEGIPLAKSSNYELLGNLKDKYDTSPYKVPDIWRDYYSSTSNNGDGIMGLPSSPAYGITKVGIGEYKKVEQEICCYVPGEVSHIENIMAREYKERATRTFTRSEITTEETQERESENLKDSTTTSRYEMQSEISKVLTENKSRQINANASVSAKLPSDVTIEAGTDMSFSKDSSLSNTFNTSESFAEDITQRAMERIVEKTSYKRTSKMIKEFEENNKHGFDNKLGDKHVTGIYRWVDKIYKNTLTSYGQRLIYDIMVPEPAKNFKNWMTNQPPSNAQLITAPIKLEITNEFGITPNNAARIAALYGADIEPCPRREIVVSKSFSEKPTPNDETKKSSGLGSIIVPADKPGDETKWQKHGFGFSLNDDIEIPEGYYSYKANVNGYQFIHDYDDCISSKGDGSVNVGKVSLITVANEQIKTYKNNRISHPTGTSYEFDVKNNEKSIAVSCSTLGIGTISFNVTVRCLLCPGEYEAWQARTYLAICEAYRRRLQEYNDAKSNEALPNPNANIDYNFNPMNGRIIEQRELKRSCIELMTKPFNINMASNHYIKNASDNYEITRNLNFENHSALSRFFEEAFDWGIMDYTFFPYYWAGDSDWESLIKEKSSADAIFQAFLQSGMGRVTLPVRAGYETAVLYYLDTGRIWLGTGMALDLENPLYHAIYESMLPKEVETDPHTWLTRIPTELTILQSDSAPLQANGLPCNCCDEDKELFCSPIGQGSSIMSGNNATNGLTLEQILASINAIISNGGDVAKDIITLLYGNKGGAASEDCMKVFEDFIGLIGTYNNTISDYTNSVIDCTSALANLNSQLSSLDSMLTNATNYGCDTSIMQAKRDEIAAKIAEITAVCNP